MTCHEIRSLIDREEETVLTREHMRLCVDCLEYAVHREPATMFVALGGEQIEPPGGIEPFVETVMEEIRLRETERSMARPDRALRRMAWLWAAAAILFITVTTFVALRPDFRQQPADPLRTEVVAAAERSPVSLSPPFRSLPVVDNYDRAGAMIVELPASDDELKIVMIFDEGLPQDL
jgi:hypothetical protein